MSLPDDIDTQEPLYPCPICGVALARARARDAYYCEHCNAEWSATAMAMIAYPEPDHFEGNLGANIAGDRYPEEEE